MTDVQVYPAIGLAMIAVLTRLTVSLVQISNVRLLTGRVYEMMGQK